MMTYEQLIDRIITDGIQEVQTIYAAPEDHPKRDGALAGFEACRGKTAPELVTLWADTERETRQIRAAYQEGKHTIQDYWRSCYKMLQIEFICNVVSVGLTNNGHAPLLAHQPTMQGALKYAAIVGTSARSAKGQPHDHL